MENPIVVEDLKEIINHILPWKEFEGKRILISGANGFIPSYLVETLLFLNDNILKEKVEVIGLVRDGRKAFKRFAGYHNRNDLQIIEKDVSDKLNIKGSIDFIIHAASQASPKYYGIDPVGTIKANTIGTYNLLEIARKKKTKAFLFFSSGEVYGEVGDKIPTKEDSYGYLNPTSVRSCYAEGKRVSETMCVSWFHQYGVPVKIVRPFHTYGPGMNLDDGRVYADFVRDILLEENIVLKSDGRASRAFCYLADAVAGFFTVMLKGESGEAYNVGSDKETTILELAQELVKMFPEKRLKVIFQERQDRNSKGYLASTITRACPDISKIKKLGWSPKYSVSEGFYRTVRSFM